MEWKDVRVVSVGSLQPHMDKKFIWKAFDQTGEKILRLEMRKCYGFRGPVDYCLVQFKNEFSALRAIHKLYKKIVPGTNPTVNYNLKHITFKGKHVMNQNNSIYIGNLSPDVNDYTLFEAFVSRYPSVKHADVKLHANGRRGYGFVYFANDEEQKDALMSMQGFVGIGTHAISVTTYMSYNRVQNTETTNPPYQPIDLVHSPWRSCSQAQPSISATTTQQTYSQYHEQRSDYYADYEDASPKTRNYYTPGRPTTRNDYAQQTPTPQQSRIRLASYVHDDDNEGNDGPVRKKGRYERQ